MAIHFIKDFHDKVFGKFLKSSSLRFNLEHYITNIEKLKFIGGKRRLKFAKNLKRN